MSIPTFKYFAGGDLNLGAYIGLHSRNSELIKAVGAAKLRVTEQLENYDEIINLLSLRLHAARVFLETAEVKRLDAERDAIQKFCYFTIINASELPQQCSLYAAGNELRVVTKPFKSIGHHEMTRQTTETISFIRSLMAHPEAVATLNLTTTLHELEEVNNALATAMGLRERTMGQRIAIRGSESTDELRKRVTALLDEMARCINAAGIFMGEDLEVIQLISELNAVASHYRLVARQHKPKRK
jgi:hypothetical protein